MAKAKKRPIVGAKKKLGAVAIKYFVQDAHDRDFTLNGHDVQLRDGEKKEVAKEVADALLKAFPYLVVTKE